VWEEDVKGREDNCDNWKITLFVSLGRFTIKIIMNIVNYSNGEYSLEDGTLCVRRTVLL
jgi:hypothetical protein